MKVEKELQYLTRKHVKVPDDYVISAKDDMVYKLGMDSLSLIELIVDIEEQFGIEIEEERIDVIYKYGELLNYIKERINR